MPNPTNRHDKLFWKSVLLTNKEEEKKQKKIIKTRKGKKRKIRQNSLGEKRSADKLDIQTLFLLIMTKYVLQGR